MFVPLLFYPKGEEKSVLLGPFWDWVIDLTGLKERVGRSE